MELENKVSEQINDIKKENLEKLAQLFPSIIKDGQVDFKALKEELGEFEEVKEERYEFTWAGKQNAKKKVQEDVGARTLKYIEEDSKNPDTTENLYIEGDNLEVLKLLRQNYYGSIKMIYIDPPYNTGKDFVYKDNFNQDGIESDIQEGSRDEEGNRLEINNKSSNKYHANWLNMIYPRLKVARDLLTDDGIIFISIDDNEQENLKKICNEIFGEENFIANNTIITGANQSGEGVIFQKNVENCLCFAKNINNVYINRVDKTEESYRNLNDAPTPLETRLDMGYTIYYNSTTGEIIPKIDYNKELVKKYNSIEKVYVNDENLIKKGFIPIRPEMRNGKLHRWRWGIDTFLERKNEIVFFETKNGIVPKFKQTGYNAPKNIHNFTGGTLELKKLFNGKNIFDYSKGINFLKYFSNIGSKKDSIILDFFSGSATTAHAVMQLNAEDGGNRKYIMVQLSEEVDEKSEAYKFLKENNKPTNICEIGKERIRRAGELIKKEIEESNRQLQLGEEPKKVPDIGFKVFRTADTNINWKKIREVSKDNVMKFDDPDMLDFTLGFNDKDVVYEVLLRQRDLPLSEKLVTLTDIGSRTYLYADSYLVCLETNVTEELIEKLAELNPLPIKFIFRDSAFGSKIGLKEETFRKLKTLVEKNSGLTKKAYTVEFI